MPTQSSQHSGFGKWPRVVTTIVAILLLGFGVLAVFKTDGGVATATLVAAGAVLGYVALANDKIRELSTSGLKFQQASAELTGDALSGDPNIPEEVQEYVVAWFETRESDLPKDVRQDLRAANSRRATKAAVLAELCDEIGIPVRNVSRGSSLPAEVFREAAELVGQSTEGPMPTVAGRIVRAAGMDWSASDWSAGSTVTLSGLKKVLDAVRTLKNEPPKPPSD